MAKKHRSESKNIDILSDYATIQEAVYKASPKDTIIVSNCYNGTKENVDVYKDNLIIMASGDFTIEANDDEDHMLNVTGDHTNISGFNIIGASDNIVVESNASSNIFYGICMYDSNNMVSCMIGVHTTMRYQEILFQKIQLLASTLVMIGVDYVSTPMK